MNQNRRVPVRMRRFAAEMGQSQACHIRRFEALLPVTPQDTNHCQICKPSNIQRSELNRLAGRLVIDTEDIDDERIGKRVALIGAGPASLTVARDLAPLGYDIVIYDSEPRGGGMIRSQIPRFRLPESVIDEEVDYIVGIGGIETRYGQRVESLAGVIAEGYDADFALVDPDSSWVVRAADSESAQEYTPFEGFEMSARVTDTFVRGHHVLADGGITGQPQGRDLRRCNRRGEPGPGE